MKFRGFYYDMAFVTTTAVAGLSLSALTALKYNKSLGIFAAAVFAVLFIYGFIRAFGAGRRYRKILKKTAAKIDYTDNKVLSTLPFPVVVCDDNGFVTWCSDSFSEQICTEPVTQTTNIKTLTDDFNADDRIFSVKTSDKYYTVYSTGFYSDGTKSHVLMFFDNTQLKKTEEEYLKSRPYAIVFEMNNIDDNNDISRDSEKTEVKSMVEGIVDDWCEKYDSVVKKVSSDRLMVLTETENFNRMITDRFSVLDEIRELSYKGKKIGVTLSAGAATGSTISKAEKEAKKSIELALDRGGDQVAVKKDNDYIFFGGVSKSTDRKFRVRVRAWSDKLTAEIKNSSNVLICGHQFSDFDSLGSSLGIAYACSSIGVKANIAFNPEKTLAGPLYQDIIHSEFSDYFVGLREAKELSGPDTLFILTDTHSGKMCEYPELFAESSKRVIIDHHRVSPGNDVDNCLFIHNPGVSSACEIVSEIVQYIIPDGKVPPAVADALLSGIALDTKNYILRSGVLTFESIAYLCRSGADTLKVNRYFSSSLEVSKEIKKAVLNAELYDGFVVSQVQEGTSSAKLIAAKAADELLNTSSTKASFVLYEDDGSACVSARSFGETNVQIIMEALGGGGHQTMAACQMKDTGIEELKSKLVNELNKTGGQ